MRVLKTTIYLKTISLYILLLVFLFPFLVIILNTFKTTQQFVESPLSLPTRFSFDNYGKAFKDMDFITGFLNSSMITIISVLLIVLFSSMTGYLFVRFNWKANSVLFYAMLASMTLPFQALMIPLVVIYGDLGLLNSKGTLLFMYLGFGVPFAVFTFHGFIKGVPLELEESASIDGSSRARTFFQIVVPLLKPVMVTLIVLDTLWIWNDYLLPSLLLQSPSMRTLPLSNYGFFSTYSVDFSPLMAGLIMTIIPVLILYLILQKHIIKGITEGALK
ncbi:carbohydrate ABC transporter permease [Cohnella lupini]|uniref:Carbohydrate ABC transporter membrane protein 2 (CUT1 family) n=1 Tax=Cohnella lupini TaxID=1294267 RepID=A0A3D9I3I7_9BACL|nr:carbohydrate ABC transporter permease [Cohnella lupini]RED56314.1 carbohydrate ABC transporter membrane protein 2 (CUT1 family) [Cohnella lupini]